MSILIRRFDKDSDGRVISDGVESHEIGDAFPFSRYRVVKDAVKKTHEFLSRNDDYVKDDQMVMGIAYKGRKRGSGPDGISDVQIGITETKNIHDSSILSTASRGLREEIGMICSVFSIIEKNKRSLLCADVDTLVPIPDVQKCKRERKHDLVRDNKVEIMIHGTIDSMKRKMESITHIPVVPGCKDNENIVAVCAIPMNIAYDVSDHVHRTKPAGYDPIFWPFN